MDIWLRRCASFAEEAEADAEFWRRFTPGERVSILEQMRREWRRRNGVARRHLTTCPNSYSSKPRR